MLQRCRRSRRRHVNHGNFSISPHSAGRFTSNLTSAHQSAALNPETQIGCHHLKPSWKLHSICPILPGQVCRLAKGHSAIVGPANGAPAASTPGKVVSEWPVESGSPILTGTTLLAEAARRVLTVRLEAVRDQLPPALQRAERDPGAHPPTASGYSPGRGGFGYLFPLPARQSLPSSAKGPSRHFGGQPARPAIGTFSSSA